MTLTEQDVIRFQEAKSCKDCIGWHKHCKTECCKTIAMRISPEEIKNAPGQYYLLRLKRQLSSNDQRYYELHDVRYTRGTLRFKKDRLHIIGRNVFYLYPCKNLDENNLCIVHDTSKPQLCRELTLETAEIMNGKGCLLTDNCLFKYKEKGGSKNG